MCRSRRIRRAGLPVPALLVAGLFLLPAAALPSTEGAAGRCAVPDIDSGTAPNMPAGIAEFSVPSSFASDPDGRAWIVWSSAGDSGTYLRYRVCSAGEWSRPAYVATGMKSNTAPVVRVDPSGVPWVIWAGFDGRDDDIFFARWDGRRWDRPRRVHGDNRTPDILPCLDVDEEGGMRVRWQSFKGLSYVPRSSLWNGREWEEEGDEGKGFAPPAPHSGAGSPPASPELETIVGFGDSLAQGFPFIEDPGDGRRVGGYEPVLEGLLGTAGRNSHVLNYGRGGETTVEGLARINSLLAGVDADYILIMEGTNDFWSAISVPTTIFNLGQMIDMSRARGTEPLLATITPDPRPEAAGKDIPTAYNPEIRALALQKGVILADHYAELVGGWDDYTDESDRLHPNVSGYQAMADVWFRALHRVRTGPAADVRPTSVVLQGTVDSHGAATGVSFEYGRSASPERRVVAVPGYVLDAGSTPVTARLTGLSPRTDYYYRLAADTNGRTTYGLWTEVTTATAQLTWMPLLLEE